MGHSFSSWKHSMDPQAFGTAKTKIMSLQKDMIALAMRMSDAIAELQEFVPLCKVSEQLKIECGLAPTDLKFYSALRSKIGARLPIESRKRLSFSTLRSIAMTNEESREVALATIAAGSVVTATDVTKIRARLRHDRTPEAARWEFERSRIVAKAAMAKATEAVEALDRRVTKLMKGLYDLRSDRSPSDYDRLKRVRMKFAAEILVDFDRILGSDKSGPAHRGNMDYEDPACRLGRAREALVHLASGRFGRGYGWGLIDGVDEDSMELVDALFVLSGHISRSPLYRPHSRNRKLATLVPCRLTAVELCAGAGGMLIGMHAAGFEHLAAIEVDPKAAATLRRNVPGLNVVEADLRTVDFTAYRGVDVVVGGLPCQPYSIHGSRKGKNDDRELFLAGVRAVQKMKPRAFAFENVSGFAQVTHARYRNVLIRLFGRVGYDVQLVTVDAQDWGVPQRRQRVIVVGLRRDQDARMFSVPFPPENFRLDVGNALLDLMRANGWTGAAEWAGRRRATYTLRNEKIDRGAVTPTLVGYSGKAPRNSAIAWEDLEINISRRPQRAPSAEEAAAPGFIPGLTEQMRARIQGFPDSWIFDGGLSHRDQQIANAFPPNAARAVGLALYTALEGLEFDVDAVMRTPVLGHDMVKPKRKIIPAPSLAPGWEVDHRTGTIVETVA
jgi:DNA (cytosine-5)-methyltransferase 1